MHYDTEWPVPKFSEVVPGIDRRVERGVSKSEELQILTSYGLLVNDLLSFQVIRDVDWHSHLHSIQSGLILYDYYFASDTTYYPMGMLKAKTSILYAFLHPPVPMVILLFDVDDEVFGLDQGQQ